jgi:hypothetical protein
MARVIAAIVAGIEASEKPTKPKSVASEAPVTKASATETAAVKAAAMKTAAIRLGTSSCDQRSRAITTMATVFNNLRVMRPSFSLPPSYHSRFEGIYAGPRRDCYAKMR